MQRDFRRLRNGPFDLLVVGGGIYGAWTAYDAALRGLSVALIEQNDWASATSMSSSKLVHGGLRYLEYLHLGLVRKTLDERRRLVRLGPHRVRPLRFLMPAYRDDRVSRWRMAAGMWIYDRLAGRNQPVPSHRRLSAGAVRDLAPFDTEGLRGGFLFGDCRTDDARFTLEIVDGAHRAGAVTVNRAGARELLFEKGRIVGARVADGDHGETIEVRAGCVISCAGPWQLALPEGLSPPADAGIRMTRGVHLVLPPLGGDDALVVSSNDDARIVFLIPWYGRTLLGTTDTDYEGDPGEVHVEPEDVDYLLDRIGRVLGELNWTRRDVIAAFAGVRALPDGGDAAPSRVSREWRVARVTDGLLLSLGGKLTSSRADAATLVDHAMGEIGKATGARPTDERAFPWAPERPIDGWLAEQRQRGTALGLDPETSESCALRYGSGFETLSESIRERPELGRRIVDDLPFCMAEVLHAVREEMALGLEDILRRRIPLMLLTRPSRAALERVASAVADELEWSAERRRAEIDSVGAPRPLAATP